MTFATALANLSALTVSGIAHNYSVDSVPDSLHRAQLPALLVMPIDAQADQLFAESGHAFEGVAFADGTKQVQYTTTHLLLVAPAPQGRGLRDHLPTLVSAIDAYMSALSADIRLGDALSVPATVRIEPALYTHGKTQYVGCAFRHTWTISV
ncbi:MAG: hypothetical protein AAFN11_06605 [Chloroflexota bacterium]